MRPEGGEVYCIYAAVRGLKTGTNKMEDVKKVRSYSERWVNTGKLRMTDRKASQK